MLAFLAEEKKRFGVSVSKRVGNAVVRNRIKRVARDFFRLSKDAFPCGDTVAMFNTGAAKSDNEKIRRDMKTALIKLQGMSF